MSLWWDLVPRPKFSPDDIDQEWDVVIVGAGFSGLWTAHHLLISQPELKIAILDKGHAGSGASGRNGGWVSDLYPVSDEGLTKDFSATQIESLHHELRISIDEIGHFAQREKIECGFQKGGAIVVARNGGQLARLRNESSHGEVLLNELETREKISMSGTYGSVFNPDCAVVNPAALVIGLAKALENRGVSIFENHLATIASDRSVHVNGRLVKAGFVVRATEAYTERTRGQIPIYSLIVATEPLSDSLLTEIGLRDREAFAEASHLVTYAQRTADNRLVIGGRGAPYSWGSRRKDSFESRTKDHDRLRAMAKKWFPVLAHTKFTHSWGGAVAVTRDWSPYVRIENGYGEMGGYVGDGVTLSYLAAHSMADRILKKNSTRANLPYVQWKSRRWETEPFRWLSVNGAIQLTKIADREEDLTNRPSVIMRTLNPLLGR
ncbi:MAG: FAD-dependent oxidoreductase [Actinobacteria bacterium]|nr:FAD-dependent oxidoreductase [Actinomycetota bacterium]